MPETPVAEPDPTGGFGDERSAVHTFSDERAGTIRAATPAAETGGEAPDADGERPPMAADLPETGPLRTRFAEGGE